MGHAFGEGTIAWQLRQMSDVDLLERDLDHFVCREMVRRRNLPAHIREKAVQWQADRTNRSRLAQLLQSATSLDPDEDALEEVIGMVLVSNRQSIVQERERLLEIATGPEYQSELRKAAWACIAIGDNDFELTWKMAERHAIRRSCSELMDSIVLLQQRDDVETISEMAWNVMSRQLPDEMEAVDPIMGRYVRVSLPRPGTITLAEVEVLENGRNIALGKPCRQSSTAWNGEAALAVDGDRDGIFSRGTSTHTREDDDAPFWEIDLEQTHSIDEIRVSGRSERPHDRRLDGHRIEILDESRAEIWSLEDLPAPQFTSHHEIGRTWIRFWWSRPECDEQHFYDAQTMELMRVCVLHERSTAQAHRHRGHAVDR